MNNSLVLNTVVKKISLDNQNRNRSYVYDCLKKCSLGSLVCISTSLKNTNTINYLERSLKNNIENIMPTTKVSAARSMKNGRMYSKLFALNLLRNTRVTPYTPKNLHHVAEFSLQTSLVTALISREIRYVFITGIQRVFESNNNKPEISRLLRLCKHLAQSAGIIFVFEFNHHSQRKQGEQK